MPKPTKGPRLGGGPAHERLMLAQLASQLLEHRSITTTVTKAKRVRPLVERMITFGKRGDLASRRRVMSVIRDKSVVHYLFSEIAPAMEERAGGYTRIIKIGPRKGDNAEMAVIELCMEPVEKKQTVKEAEAATKRAVKEASAKKKEKAADAAADDEAAESVENTAEASAESTTEAETSVDASEGTSDVPEGKYGAGSAAAVEGGAAPSSEFTIKGNEDSMKYHTPKSQWYDKTVAEVWFNSEESAEKAGFKKAG